MKKVLPLVLFVSSFFTTTQVSAQACPRIENSSFRIITENESIGRRRVRFIYVNPSNGSKSINIRVYDKNTLLLNVCHPVSGYVNSNRTYNSPSFNITNITNLVVEITPYTGGSSCGGSSCAPTVRSQGGAALPVEFGEFQVLRQGRQVQLNWETYTEMYNTGFQVERNRNGNWEQVGFVKTKAADGNSQEKLSYQYTDMNNFSGQTQYRIRQVDIDGSFRYSEVRTVRGEESAPSLLVYPNPSASGQVTVSFSDSRDRQISLVDISGRIVRQWNGIRDQQWQITGLTPGTYLLRSLETSTQSVQVTKLLVQAR